jgi:plasmid maintenance system antidote protein VapI
MKRNIQLMTAMVESGLNVGAMAKSIGVHRVTISRWLHGHNRPTKKGAARCAAILEKSTAELFGGEK